MLLLLYACFKTFFCCKADALTGAKTIRKCVLHWGCTFHNLQYAKHSLHEANNMGLNKAFQTSQNYHCNRYININHQTTLTEQVEKLNSNRIIITYIELNKLMNKIVIFMT